MLSAGTARSAWWATSAPRPPLLVALGCCQILFSTGCNTTLQLDTPDALRGRVMVISDLEVENREVTDTLYSIDYPIEGSDEVLTVATVRPETMLADTAVAVNPTMSATGRWSVGHCVLPLVGRRLPIIADEHVDPEFGTGALKITPGHDPNDFEIGRAHGLEEIVVIGEDGRMTEEAGERFAGLTVDRGAARRWSPRFARRAGSEPRSPTCTRSPSRTARGSGSSR